MLIPYRGVARQNCGQLEVDWSTGARQYCGTYMAGSSYKYVMATTKGKRKQKGNDHIPTRGQLCQV